MSSWPVILSAALQLVQTAAALAPPRPEGFIPTSMAMDIARKVAVDEGYEISDKRYFFDFPLIDDKAPMPGFIMIELYGGHHALLQVAISEATGQIADGVSCRSFEYSNLKNFQKEIQRETHTPAMTADELAAKMGCPTLERVSRPIRHR